MFSLILSSSVQRNVRTTSRLPFSHQNEPQPRLPSCSDIFTPNEALFLSFSFNSHPTIKHTATSLQILLSQPTTATRHTLKQLLLLYIKHKLPLALFHKDSFSPQSFIYLETCFLMKIGVKPSDLAYHVFCPFYPLTLHKEETLADILRFPKYSREAFLKDIAAHFDSKPVSESDSVDSTPLHSAQDSEPSALAQKAFQLAELRTKEWIFGGDSSVEGLSYDYSQTSGTDNSDSSRDTNSSSEQNCKLTLLQHAWTRLWTALLHKEYNSIDLELTDLLLKYYSIQAPTLTKKAEKRE